MGTEWDGTARSGPEADSSQEHSSPEPSLNPPGGEPGPAPDGWPGQDASDTVEFSTPAVPKARRTRRFIVAAGAAGVVVAIAAVALAITQSGSSKTSPGLTPAQTLTAAVHTSGAVKSLSATYSEQVGGAVITGSVQEVRKPLQVSMAMTERTGGQTVPISGIMTSTAMYLKLSGMPGVPKSIAGKWMEIPLTGGVAGSMTSLLQSLENENPVSQTPLLAAAKHVRADGTAVVDGVQTTKYTGNYAPAAAMKFLPAAFRASAGSILKELTGNIDFTVWIDSSHLIRKMTEVETVASQTLTVTITYISINQPVTITLPPASEVMQIPGSTPGSS